MSPVKALEERFPFLRSYVFKFCKELWFGKNTPYPLNTLWWNISIWESNLIYILIGKRFRCNAFCCTWRTTFFIKPSKFFILGQDIRIFVRFSWNLITAKSIFLANNKSKINQNFRMSPIQKKFKTKSK